MYLGQDRHILTFPLQDNTRVNVVAFKTDRSKPVGHRIWNKGPWVEDVSQAEMLADFDDWGNGVKRLLRVRALADSKLSKTLAETKDIWETDNQDPQSMGVARALRIAALPRWKGGIDGRRGTSTDAKSSLLD
jgi:hypothetical protein